MAAILIEQASMLPLPASVVAAASQPCRHYGSVGSMPAIAGMCCLLVRKRKRTACLA